MEVYFSAVVIFYHHRALSGFTEHDYSNEVTYMRGLVHGIFVITGLLCFQLLEVRLMLIVICFVIQ